MLQSLVLTQYILETNIVQKVKMSCLLKLYLKSNTTTSAGIVNHFVIGVAENFELFMLAVFCT